MFLYKMIIILLLLLLILLLLLLSNIMTYITILSIFLEITINLLNIIYLFSK